MEIMHTNTGAHMQYCFLPTALAILEVCSGERVLIMNSLTGFDVYGAANT